MLKDIKQLTELYLYSRQLLPEGKSWSDFHDEIDQNASLDLIKLLVDASPKEKCKYALFVDVNTEKKACEVKDYTEMDALGNWESHLFWQGSGGAQSDKVRNTPHKIYSKKGDFSTDNFIAPLETILKDYCQIQESKGGKKISKIAGPLFWDKNREEERRPLKNVIAILKNKKEEINKHIKGEKNQQGKFPSIKLGESVFVGLTIDGRSIGEYELFRRYLLFVRTRAGIQKGTDLFRNKDHFNIIEGIKGVCPSCQKVKPLLNQWPVPAELSFYQITSESHLSYAYSAAPFRLCQGCANLLFIFKQHLLKVLSRKIGGNECLILPSIKLLPIDKKEKRRLYDNLQGLWDLSSQRVKSSEERLLYKLGQLPSYATITFIFGEYITTGKSQNVRRLDELNVIFPDVLPSRLSRIADAIKSTNERLLTMWACTGRNWQCTWNVQDDFYLLYQIFYPSWEEKKKDKSRRRPEMERYLRAIFYGQEVFFREIAEDCYSNLLSIFKKTHKAIDEDKNKYALSNYIGNLFSLFVFLEQLNIANESKKEVKTMTGIEKIPFSFTAMPDLGEFVRMHPLLKDRQYLAPFFVGCLFSYTENLQKDSSRLAAYNWLGTMALTYDDILQDIYPKVLNYIKNKEKFISSPRLQELMKAISHYDSGRCENDRVALVAFCHGWALGRDFIYKKDIVKEIKKKLKDLKISITEEIKGFLDNNKEKLNLKDYSTLEELLKLVPEAQKIEISSTWQKSNKEKTIEEGGKDDEQ